MAKETLGSATARRRGPTIKETFGLDQYAFSKSKWLLLGAAGLMVGLGLALAALSPGKSSTAASAGQRQASSGPGLLGSSFAESLPPADNASSPAPDAAEGINSQDFSAFLVKGGFGAFIGFAIGFAMRSFIRLATVIIGFYLLTLTIMSYLGWVEIHWTVMQEQFNHSITTLGEQLTSFQSFLTGAIPSTGMAAVGLTFGLRKR